MKQKKKDMCFNREITKDIGAHCFRCVVCGMFFAYFPYGAIPSQHETLDSYKKRKGIKK